MPTFEIGKDVDEIQEPKLLDKDWYLLEIIEDPARVPNKIMKASGASAEGAGYNLYLVMAVLDPHMPEVNGRIFKKWYPFPNLEDNNRFTQSGQSYADWKATKLKDLVEGFSGQPMKGSAFNLVKGQKAYFFISQVVANDGPRKGQLVNEVDDGAGMKPYTGKTDIGSNVGKVGVKKAEEVPQPQTGASKAGAPLAQEDVPF